MTLAETSKPSRIASALAEKPDGVLEAVASSCGTSLLAVLQELPDEQVSLVQGHQFEALWTALTAWGEVLVIVHTPDIVLECTAPLPPGTFGHGYFNVHGDSSLSGHIKASNCAHIAFVDRLFHGKRSCSIQFLNMNGNAMFKVFVKRGKDRTLDELQLARFEALRTLMQE